MQGHKQFVDKVVLRFRLSERVSKQNLYRRLAELLDWDFLYEQTQALYSHTGQPSLDPVVFFKLLLVSRLENLVSDRRLVEHCSLRLDILYLLGYGVDEDLPWHSTSSRTRRFCPAACLVTDYTQAVNSAFVKANTSLESLCEKQAAKAAPILHAAGEPVSNVPIPPPTTLISSPAHQLQRLASTHASATDQNSDTQFEDLIRARCACIFQEKVSGTRSLALDGVLVAVSEGDKVVNQLARLGRNTVHTIQLEEFNHCGVHFRALDLGIDSRTPAGKMVVEIFSPSTNTHERITARRASWPASPWLSSRASTSGGLPGAMPRKSPR